MKTAPGPSAPPADDHADLPDRGVAAPCPLAQPPGSACSPGRPTHALRQQLLAYRPDGPLGGTFTCVACGAQAWQPDLLGHAPACPYRP